MLSLESLVTEPRCEKYKISYCFLLFPGIIVVDHFPVLSHSVVIIKGHGVVVLELPAQNKKTLGKGGSMCNRSTNSEVRHAWVHVLANSKTFSSLSFNIWEMGLITPTLWDCCDNLLRCFCST